MGMPATDGFMEINIIDGCLLTPVVVVGYDEGIALGTITGFTTVGNGQIITSEIQHCRFQWSHIPGALLVIVGAVAIGLLTCVGYDVGTQFIGAIIVGLMDEKNNGDEVAVGFVELVITDGW